MKNKSSKNDLTIDECLRFRKIEEAFLSRCRHFGYNEIKTSTIEPLYIFTALGALNEAKLRRIYSFIDWDGWSGERVALKPDSTACVARFYGEHLFPKNPRQKLCYVENHFEWADSWDDISERWQCGIEDIGNKNPESDVEAIYMACDIIQKIGFEKYYLYLSYPSITKEINAISFDKQGGEVFINAIEKSSENHTADYLENIKSCLHRSAYEKVQPAFENFVSICRKLDSLECKYVIDFSAIGDLKYYTGIQFQVLSTPKRKSKSDILCSGGRYDNFIKEMWKLPEAVPAVGFALYIRNILRHGSIMKDSSESIDQLQNICIYVSNITKHDVKTGQMLCDKLSRLGFVSQITLNPVEKEKYESFGLVIEVDHERFIDGYQVLYSQKIGKPLLKNLFGEFNA